MGGPAPGVGTRPVTFSLIFWLSASAGTLVRWQEGRRPAPAASLAPHRVLLKK